MRRREKEITDRSDIDAVIRQCQVCHLGLTDGDQPYVVPLSFGYDGEAVYFHSAKLGRKIDLLQSNPRVCVQFEINDGLITGPEACDWSTAYRSVMGFGTACLVEDPAAKHSALALLMAQYSPGEFTFSPTVVDRTAIIKVTLDLVTGKRSTSA